MEKLDIVWKRKTRLWWHRGHCARMSGRRGQTRVQQHGRMDDGGLVPVCCKLGCECQVPPYYTRRSVALSRGQGESLVPLSLAEASLSRMLPRPFSRRAQRPYPAFVERAARSDALRHQLGVWAKETAYGEWARAKVEGHGWRGTGHGARGGVGGSPGWCFRASFLLQVGAKG